MPKNKKPRRNKKTDPIHSDTQTAMPANILTQFKNSITKAAGRMGYEIIPAWKLGRKPESDLLGALFSLHGIATVLDVGANKGQYADYLRNHLDFRGRIISFEPIRENCLQLLEKASGRRDWDIRDFALGNENTSQDLQVMKADVFSSFLNPTTEFTHGFEQYNAVARTEKVAIRRLDDILDEIDCHPSRSPVYLKIDTQGYDMEVIKGAKSALQDIRALQTELSVINIYENMPSMLEVITYLDNLGFKMAGMFPVSRDQNMKVVEFDAVFVNDRFSRK